MMDGIIVNKTLTGWNCSKKRYDDDVVIFYRFSSICKFSVLNMSAVQIIVE